MGAGSSGLINCPNTNFDYSTLPNLNTVKTSVCYACPATLHTSCKKEFGSEWGNDESVAEGTGCRLQCKRVGYNNPDNLGCCLGNKSTDYKITCNPSLTPTSSTCTNLLNNWCLSNINDPKCINLPYYKNILLNYCLNPENIKTNSSCRSFLSGPDSAGKMDLVMSSYCKNNPADSLCCYMNSAIPCPNKFDTRCNSSAAYQSNAMVSTTCPNVLTCNQYINIPNGSKIFATNIEATCNLSNTKDSNPTNSTSNPTNSTSNPTNSTSNPTNSTSNPTNSTSNPTNSTSNPTYNLIVNFLITYYMYIFVVVITIIIITFINH
jgi:hypothetical protein